MLAGIALLLIVPTALPGDRAGEQEDTSAWAQVAVEAFRNEHGLPAASLAIHADGRTTIVSTGTTRLGGEIKVAADAVWHMGSNGKSITGMLAGILVDEGLIRFDSKLGDVVPAAKPFPEAAHLTLWDLLSHRSGLSPDTYFPGADWFRPRDDWRQTRLDYLAKALARPRSKPDFQYSNANYVLAAVMLETVTGKPYEVLVADRIARPLGLKIEFGGAPSEDERHPWPHTGKSEFVPARPTPWGAAPDNGQAVAPAGCMAMSNSDQIKLLKVWLEGGKPLLKAETARRLMAPPEGGSYAGGLIVVERSWAKGTAYTHSGNNTMNGQSMWIAPGRGWILIASTNAAPDKIESKLNDLIVKTIRHLE